MGANLDRYKDTIYLKETVQSKSQTTKAIKKITFYDFISNNINHMAFHTQTPDPGT